MINFVIFNSFEVGNTELSGLFEIGQNPNRFFLLPIYKYHFWVHSILHLSRILYDHICDLEKKSICICHEPFHVKCELSIFNIEILCWCMALNVSLQMVRNSAAKPISHFVQYMCCRWSCYHQHLHSYTAWSGVCYHQIENNETDGIILCNLMAILPSFHVV